MLTLITGGTGFIGAHTVAAVLDAGHRVRMLVRDPARVPAAMAPFGVHPAAVDVVVGDVTREADVARAVDGCDAVVHAAELYSFDSRVAAAMTTNVRGTEVVLRRSRAAGADPIV